MPTKSELMSRLAASRVEVERLSALKLDVTRLQMANHELRVQADHVPVLSARILKQDAMIDSLKAELDAAGTIVGKHAREHEKSVAIMHDELKQIRSKIEAAEHRHAKAVDKLKAEISAARARPEPAAQKEQRIKLAVALATVDKLERELASK